MVSLPYHEPNITTILAQSSLIFLLNVLNSILDKALYCGLLGQILLGVAWGAPGAQILGDDAQHVVVQLGYLGLIMLVYEGGLSMPIASLKANLALSMGVALVGVAVPIAVSFILILLMHATPLQAFTAGAALCSTSLGTTFTVLSSSGLVKTRLGVVLSTAAMIDDVIGLIVVQVVSNLDGGTEEISASVVVKPLLTSLAFAVIVPLICKLIFPLVRIVEKNRILHGKVLQILCRRESRMTLHLLILFAFVAAGSYAGTSNLFTAYLAGAVINWWNSANMNSPSPSTRPETTGASDTNQNDGENLQASTTPKCGVIPAGSKTSQRPESGRVRNPVDDQHTCQDVSQQYSGRHLDRNNPTCEQQDLSGHALYTDYLAQSVNRILKPFFFASIGFSIPLASLFRGSLLWRGLVYACLMTLSKAVCGLWLSDMPWARSLWKKTCTGWLRFRHLMALLLNQVSNKSTAGESARKQTIAPAAPPRPSGNTSSSPQPRAEAGEAEAADVSRRPHVTDTAQRRPDVKERSVSLYPAAILGSAMIARGEIGFLIASVAESNDVWQPRNTNVRSQPPEGSSGTFIVVTWAILICTFVGPITVGTLVRRVKTLEKGRDAEGRGGRDVLGAWRVTEASREARE